MKLILLLAFSLTFFVFCCQTSNCQIPNIPPSIEKSTRYLDQLNSKNNQSYDPEPIADVPVRPRAVSVSLDSATNDELLEISEHLYCMENSMINKISINLQGKTQSVDTNDVAPDPLLQVRKEIQSSKTIARMKKLFNNYEMDAAVAEIVTRTKLKEQDDFLDAVMDTKVMRQAMIFLQSKGIVTGDTKNQQNFLKKIWFKLYPRVRNLGSSGFEHVFLNEVKNSQIIGLHNWVYFNQEEQAGRLDYKGYINDLNLGSKAKGLDVRFTLNYFNKTVNSASDLNKPVDSLFIGTTPELEISLYTICFTLRPDQKCKVSMGGKNFFIKTHLWRWKGDILVGAAYPQLH